MEAVREVIDEGGQFLQFTAHGTDFDVDSWEAWIACTDISKAHQGEPDLENRILGYFAEWLRQRYQLPILTIRGASQVYDRVKDAIESQKKTEETTPESPTGSDSIVESGATESDAPGSPCSTDATPSESCDSPMGHQVQTDFAT